MAAEQTHLEEIQARADQFAEAIKYFIPKNNRKNRTGKGVMEKAALRLSNECVRLLEQIAKPQ